MNTKTNKLLPKVKTIQKKEMAQNIEMYITDTQIVNNTTQYTHVISFR